jgi:predicted nuclease of predicted toxin-antitoxin system
MPIRFHLDEHVDPAVAVGLRRRGIDVSTTVEAGLLGAPDNRQLAWAIADARVIFTQDQDFLRLSDAGAAHAGIVFNKQGTRTIGQIIEFLELLFLCVSEEDMRKHVEFF